MQLLEVPNCPIDGVAGAVRYAGIHDAYFGTQGRWHYRQHDKTGHLWLDPRPADPAIGILYANYYTHATERPAETGDLWRQAIAWALSGRLRYPVPEKTSFLAKLVSHMPSVGDAAELEVMRIPASESGHLLDVGCGDGTFLRRMRAAGWTVAGTEPDAKAAARLAAQEGFPVYSALEDLVQEQSQRFDVIVLSHVVEHLPDPTHTLVMLRRLLNKEGRLLLTTPNALSLGLRIFGTSWRGLEPPRHFNVFTPDSLCQLLRSVGFHVERVRTDVRLARGIWFLSFLARAGGRELEITRPPGHRLLKLAGYIFQIFEAGAVKLMPDTGEEIFCDAKVGRDAGALGQ